MSDETTQKEDQQETDPDAPVAEVVPPPKKAVKDRDVRTLEEKLRDRFCSLTGYTDSDIVGVNLSRRIFVTSNGGKYSMSKSGKQIRREKGPLAPVEQKKRNVDG